MMNNKELLLIRNSIRILLINKSNELLLMYVDDPKTTSADGSYRGAFWCSIGGEIESGEDVKDAAIRELKEETGLNIKDVTFGPIVWFGEFKMMLYGQMTQLKQQFIVAHTEKTQITLKYLTPEEKKVVKKLSWFSLDNIKSSKEIIYPIGLENYLPDILARNYPSQPIWFDLAK